MAPPPEVLLLKMQFVIDSVALLKIAPPNWPWLDPWAIVRPEKETAVPTPTLKARDELLPLTVRRLAPGPAIVIFWPMTISPVVSVMVAGSGRLNMIVSPGAAG